MGKFDKITEQLKRRIETVVNDLPPILANETKLFALENFQKKQWRGNTVENWKPRKPTNPPNEKALLVKDSHLFNSINGAVITPKGAGRAVVTISGTSYARVHNFGFKGKVRQNVRPFTRRVKGKKQEVRAFSRILNQNIPKRQFIGANSPYLHARLRKVTITELNRILK